MVAIKGCGSNTPSLAHVHIQTLHDVLADRFANLSESRRLLLARGLLKGASTWTDEQRRAVLFHSLRYGFWLAPKHSHVLAFLAWDHLCLAHFQSMLAGALVPVEGCLQAAFTLTGPSRLDRSKVLSMLRIEKQSHAFDVQAIAYQESISNCERLNTALFMKDEEKTHDLAELCLPINHQVAGLSPLMIAAFNGLYDMTRMLLERGADIHSRDRFGNNALRIVSGTRHVNVAQLLLTWGADPNKTDLIPYLMFSPLLRAMYDENEDMAEVLLEAGADANVRDAQLNTPLIHAVTTKGSSCTFIRTCTTGNTNMVNLLLAKGADPNTCDGRGVTPLMLAVSENLPPIVRALLKAGADLNLRDKQGLTAYDRAIQRGEYWLVCVLMRYPTSEQTYLHTYKMALKYGDQAVAELMGRRLGIPGVVLERGRRSQSEWVAYFIDDKTEVIVCFIPGEKNTWTGSRTTPGWRTRVDRWVRRLVPRQAK